MYPAHKGKIWLKHAKKIAWFSNAAGLKVSVYAGQSDDSKGSNSASDMCKMSRNTTISLYAFSNVCIGYPDKTFLLF